MLSSFHPYSYFVSPYEFKDNEISLLGIMGSLYSNLLKFHSYSIIPQQGKSNTVAWLAHAVHLIFTNMFAYNCCFSKVGWYVSFVSNIIYDIHVQSTQ